MLTIEAPLGEVVELSFTLPLGPVAIHAMVRQRTPFATASSSLIQQSYTELFIAHAASLPNNP